MPFPKLASWICWSFWWLGLSFTVGCFVAHSKLNIKAVTKKRENREEDWWEQGRKLPFVMVSQISHQSNTNQVPIKHQSLLYVYKSPVPMEETFINSDSLQPFLSLTHSKPAPSVCKTTEALFPSKCKLKWLRTVEGKTSMSPLRICSLIPTSKKHVSPPSQSSEEITRTTQKWRSLLSWWMRVVTLRLTTKPENGKAGEDAPAGRTSAKSLMTSYSSGKVRSNCKSMMSNITKFCKATHHFS